MTSREQILAKVLANQPNAQLLPADLSTAFPAANPLEAFATVYRSFAQHLTAVLDGKTIQNTGYPSVYDGLRGLQFISAAVQSDSNNAAWTKLL